MLMVMYECTYRSCFPFIGALPPPPRLEATMAGVIAAPFCAFPVGLIARRLIGLVVGLSTVTSPPPSEQPSSNAAPALATHTLTEPSPPYSPCSLRAPSATPSYDKDSHETTSHDTVMCFVLRSMYTCMWLEQFACVKSLSVQGGAAATPCDSSLPCICWSRATTMPIRRQPLIIPPPLSATPKRQAFQFVLIIMLVSGCCPYTLFGGSYSTCSGNSSSGRRSSVQQSWPGERRGWLLSDTAADCATQAGEGSGSRSNSR